MVLKNNSKKVTVHFLLVLNLIVWIIVYGSSSTANDEVSKSSQMQKLQISQCHEERCIQVIADQAFVSLTGDSLSVKDASFKLIIKEPKKNVQGVQNYICKNFHFDMRTQFLICDNAHSNSNLQQPSGSSFTMDEDLILNPYL